MAAAKKTETGTAKRTTVRKTAVKEQEQEIKTEAVKEEQHGYTEEQVQQMIAAALAQFKAEQQKEQPKAEEHRESDVVTLRFHDEINDSNIILLGENGRYGQIIGKDWTGQVNKMDFIGSFRTPTVQQLLSNRELIVLDGLTDEERKLYGVCYEDGEFVDPVLYNRLVKMDGDTLIDIYEKLNKTWRKMVAIKFAESYEHGELKVSRSTLVKLNRISRKDNEEYPEGDLRRRGAFRGILDKMNAAEDED